MSESLSLETGLRQTGVGRQPLAERLRCRVPGPAGAQQWSAPRASAALACLRLRVQEIDFSRHEILVRDGKGAKDRITMLPQSLKAPLEEHLRRVKAVHERDLADGWGRVLLPEALDRKYPNAPKEWRWQWVFPQEHRWRNAKTGEEGRHHVHESIIQKDVKTTMIYTHVLNRGGKGVKSPLDDA